MGLLGLLWRSSHTGTDGPDRLVSDYNLAPVLNLLANGGELAGIDGVSLARLALIQLLSDASHDVEVLVKSGLDFGGDDLIGLTKDVAPLTVAEDDPVETEVLEHGGTGLSSVGTIAVERAVLGGKLHLRSSKLGLYLSEMKEGGGDDDLHFGLAEAELLEHTAGEVAAEVNAAIALPVSSDKQFSHGDDCGCSCVFI